MSAWQVEKWFVREYITKGVAALLPNIAIVPVRDGMICGRPLAFSRYKWLTRDDGTQELWLEREPADVVYDATNWPDELWALSGERPFMKLPLPPRGHTLTIEFNRTIPFIDVR